MLCLIMLSVRICALETIDAVIGQLGEDYQNLLHESAPFLAELMEDDNERTVINYQFILDIIIGK